MKIIHISGVGLILICTVAMSAEVIKSPGLSEAQYNAVFLKSHNQQKLLPSLGYWGLGGMEWGIQPNPIQGSTQGNKNSLPHSPGTTNLFGLRCIQELERDSGTGGLIAVGYRFAQGITDRAQRLAAFNLLLGNIDKEYHAPSHSPKPVNVVRGNDAFVQGLVNQYLLEWHGPETTVSLRLSKDELVLEFRQSPSSNARQLIQSAHEAELVMQDSTLPGQATVLTNTTSSHVPAEGTSKP